MKFAVFWPWKRPLPIPPQMSPLADTDLFSTPNLVSYQRLNNTKPNADIGADPLGSAADPRPPEDHSFGPAYKPSKTDCQH